MAVFKDADEMAEIMGGFFKKVSKLAAEGDPVMQPAYESMSKANLILKFVWRDPELSLTLDATTNPMGVLVNDNTNEPVATFTLSGDTAHEFWHGKVNLPVALTKKKIIAKGPIPKILKLLPAIKPLYDAYPQYLQDIGRADLVLQ